MANFDFAKVLNHTTIDGHVSRDLSLELLAESTLSIGCPNPPLQNLAPPRPRS